jgi:hypothetical protein
LNQAEVQLDHQGGTDILQISPAQFRITQGGEHLGNLMLSPKGIYRWHTSCCQTPICNTTTKAAMPYVGLLANNISSIAQTSSDKNRRQSVTDADNNNIEEPFTDENRAAHLNDAFGPVMYGVGAGEKHPMNADWPIAKGFGFKGMFGTLKNMLTWRLRGDHKRSIFIDSISGEPLVVPTLLTREQRKAARDSI